MMGGTTSYSCFEVKRCCEKKLGIKFRKGKEATGWYLLEGKKTARITVPKGRRPVGKGLFDSMAKQLKITSQQFKDLIDCPLSGQDYKKILQTNNLDHF